MLDLYSKLYNVTKTEANQQIREALHLGQYRDDYQRPVKQERDLEPPAPVNSERASDVEIDQTYSQMLSMLTLSRKHQEDLQKRGLTPEQIAVQRYRSVPLFGIKKLVERLEDKGCTIKGVPGFYQCEDGAWSIHFTAKNSGILIRFFLWKDKCKDSRYGLILRQTPENTSGFPALTIRWVSLLAARCM